MSGLSGDLLVSLARSSILSGFNGSLFKPSRVPDELLEDRGVFVTLTLDGCLRGCMGCLDCVLVDGLVSSAFNSAFNDYRFKPLSKSEFDRVIVEVSVLSKPVSASLSGIRKGDGVIIRLSGKSALFLPQVWEELPERDEFLSQLCLKAGLSPDAFMDKRARFERFSVMAWREVSPNGSVVRVL